MPSVEAPTCDKEFARELSKAMREMVPLTSEGFFCASRSGSQRQRARRQVDRTVSATDHALHGEEFREDGLM
jgi:hypothetical protein